MKTLLIVEDEKLIRQGIKAMVQRSGVPVDVILECNNGEMALEVVREQKIDVMLTDIRMPKMDGIELVRQMQNCKDIPLTVAISGYDDFSYAVEMMRNGVREYILKPIEREKLTEVLKKLNAEIESRNEQSKTDQQIGYQQMKHLMLGRLLSEDEIAAVEKQYAGNFFQDEYRVCCQYSQKRESSGEDNYILLKNIGENDIYIVPEKNVDFLLKNELQCGYVGLSSIHRGIRALREAYEEALCMRKDAFMKNRKTSIYGEPQERVPENLIQEAERLISKEANLQRVQLLGTERAEELEKSIQKLLFVAEKGRITPQQFEDCIRSFLTEVENTYKNPILQEKELLTDCKIIWNESCLGAYGEKLMEFVMVFREKINHQYDVNKNTQKMRMAIDYIQKHYADDLNMAVVSNYISMNYSLFSYSFKQYTGNNFVNFLKNIRMNEAKKLLAETDMKIIDISQKVGYENEKHFMKIFKATYGVSPTEYRKNMNR